MRDFENIMKSHHYWKEADWNATNSVYTFGSTKIEFFSADQSERVKGPRRSILFINEANNVSYETYIQLEIRTEKVIWLDWNPVSEFWFYTELKDKPNVDFITLTYKDNEALPTSIIESIESKKHNKLFWKVYGLGELGEAEGRVYTGWQIIDDIPFEARLERRGLDFGYSNDPTVIVDIYYYNGGYILDERMYRKGLSNKQIADFLLNIEQPSTLVIADSAEPKSIDEIASYGVSIIGATKGKDSILQGIQFIQQQRVSLTKRSVNGIKEYRNFLWMTDKEGRVLNETIDLFNHFMDAIRYGFDSLKPKDTYYSSYSSKKWGIR